MTSLHPSQIRLEQELSANGLPPLWNRALALLIESNLTTPQMAKELGISRMGLWRIRKEPEFQAAYRELMAMVQADSQRFAIASRVARVEALNTAWLQARDELARRKAPRSDLGYLMIALQAEARKEIEGDVQRIEFGGHITTEQVNVIRFEALPQRQLPEPEVIEGQFAEIPETAGSPDADFARVLAGMGIRIDQGVAQKEELIAIARAIQERGLDACEVLSGSQYKAVFGYEKGADPWA